MRPTAHFELLPDKERVLRSARTLEWWTIIYLLNVGLGFWWVDPLAAALVSLSILKDGVDNVGVAVGGLIERRPMKTDQSGPEPLADALRERMEALDWVASAGVRLREAGHVFFGEVFVTPRGTPDALPAKIRHAVGAARALNWRLHDVTITVLDDDHAR